MSPPEHRDRPARSDLTRQLPIIERLILRIGWLERRRFARDLDEFGLTVPQFAVLRSIQLRDRWPTMTALADETLLRSATVTGIVDRLAKMGLVQRHRDPDDRRRILVELTETGRHLVEGVRLGRIARVQGTLSHLSPGDAQELLRLLSLYLEALGIQLEKHLQADG
jgi:DNA-binding MarR family transcriptional regulator